MRTTRRGRTACTATLEPVSATEAKRPRPGTAAGSRRPLCRRGAAAPLARSRTSRWLDETPPPDAAAPTDGRPGSAASEDAWSDAQVDRRAQTRTRLWADRAGRRRRARPRTRPRRASQGREGLRWRAYQAGAPCPFGTTPTAAAGFPAVAAGLVGRFA
jgi:hypothetical protein